MESIGLIIQIQPHHMDINYIILTKRLKGQPMLTDRKVRNGLFIKDTKSYPLRRFCQSCIKKLYKMNPCIEVLKGLMIYADKERKSNYNKV